MGSASWFDMSRQSRRRYRFPMPQNGDAIVSSPLGSANCSPSAMMRQSDQAPLGTDLQINRRSK